MVAGTTRWAVASHSTASAVVVGAAAATQCAVATRSDAVKCCDAQCARDAVVMVGSEAKFGGGGCV